LTCSQNEDEDGDEQVIIRSELIDLEIEEADGASDMYVNRFLGDAGGYYDRSGDWDENDRSPDSGPLR
jgi:hypothetical protein